MEGITFVTEAAAKWGAGKGVPAEPFEVDENFWQLLLRLKALEDNRRPVTSRPSSMTKRPPRSPS